MLKGKTSDIVARIAEYEVILRDWYGVDVATIRQETVDGWEHLVASAERGAPPEETVTCLADVLGLVRVDSPFAREAEAASLYNRYRLALRAYSEQEGLAWDEANQSPWMDVEGRPMAWQVIPVRDADGQIRRCVFGLHDPKSGESYLGVDLQDAVNEAVTLRRQRRMDDPPAPSPGP